LPERPICSTKAFRIRFVNQRLVKAVGAEIAKIQNKRIDEKDIGKVKEKRLVGLDESFKNNSYWMSALSNNLKQGNDILTLEEAKARINAVTKEYLQKAAREYLKPEQRLQFVLNPEASAPKAGQTPKLN
jgi:zinc protease